MGAQSEVSDVSRGVRCQLLKWFSGEDVIVGEGEFCSTDPVYKIGRIPLGANATAVIVNSVIDTDLSLWRPTPTMFVLGEAVGQKIPWPADKLILDEKTSTSPNIHSDESLQRCKVYDWNGNGEVIAEAVLCSTNPKHMVHNIPLGQNAAEVKIDLVLKEAVYLWRPTAELLLMVDALNASIAWPIDKIELINQNAGDESVLSKSLGVSFDVAIGISVVMLLSYISDANVY